MDKIQEALDLAASIEDQIKSELKWKRGKAGGSDRQKEFATTVSLFSIPATAAARILRGESEEQAREYASLILKDINKSAPKALDMFANSFAGYQISGRRAYFEDTARRLNK